MRAATAVCDRPRAWRRALSRPATSRKPGKTGSASPLIAPTISHIRDEPVRRRRGRYGAPRMLILAIIVLGMFIGWMAQLVLGMGTRPNGQSLVAGVVGSFLGG